MATGDYRQSWERVAEGPKPEQPPVYTPTTEKVREEYARGSDYRIDRRKWWAKKGLAEFDRWLVSVRADAWDEGFNRGYDLMVVESAQKPHAPDLRDNPYRSEKQ